MTEHPAIAAMMNSGYEYPEPITFSKCITCGEEIIIGDKYVEAAGYHYCDKDCFTKLVFQEGNAAERIAGEYD